jgi:hypothetical protein
MPDVFFGIGFNLFVRVISWQLGLGNWRWFRSLPIRPFNDDVYAQVELNSLFQTFIFTKNLKNCLICCMISNTKRCPRRTHMIL